MFSVSSGLDISTWIGSAGRYNGPLLPQPDKFKALNLSGCGNKGPLYLPAEPIQVEISNPEETENNKQPELSDDTKQNDE